MNQATEEGWWRFIDLCAGLEKDQLSQVLKIFLTAAEVDDVSMRTLLVGELLAGKKTQRQIAADLAISITKITRGSNELKRVDSHLRAMLEEALIQ
ncbi:transcriptional regulator [Piscirickettsia salmonis]|uniref:Trp operon repressor n=1 Tax=Piscirickettsia salmonis TaxID=1238 RepID=A0A095BRW4_PISSA|nr:trp operon repressor [Piscirickettsia salmonis]OAJ34602.1 Trp operon repressor [Piscirickettsiaceae bacterium NZ-RLO1]RNC78565.1 trp operon repressor [Piscirickettsiaceae bacterium NZ-RLO2]AKP72311.1 transcriptional regulator [Piscirickettsia salmonis LF-89 = ATCC VR-1361]ALA23576.1 trp operon repressor [Piscirickettsia salmonis]ALB24244.1 trp operon repressor [Piscirickettsia salmonis]